MLSQPFQILKHYQKILPKRCEDIVRHGISDSNIKKIVVKQMGFTEEEDEYSNVVVSPKDTKQLKQMFDEASEPGDFKKVHRRK